MGVLGAVAVLGDVDLCSIMTGVRHALLALARRTHVRHHAHTAAYGSFNSCSLPATKPKYCLVARFTKRTMP